MGGSWQTQKASADLSIFQLILFESLAPFCNGEPSSSSTLVVFCQSPCAVFPYLMFLKTSFLVVLGLYLKIIYYNKAPIKKMGALLYF